MKYINKLINKLSRLSSGSITRIAALSLIAIGFIDGFIDIELSVSILYLIPIAMTSWFVNRRTGVVFAISSTLIWLINDLISSLSITHPIFSYWNAIIMLGIFTSFSLLLSELSMIIYSENDLALRIQKSLLPQVSPDVESFKIKVIWEPTRVVSGDYYDFIPLDNKSFGICLADVTGHGYPSALLMSNLQAVFRNIAYKDYSPCTVCADLNQIICRSIVPDKFTSFFYGILNAESRQILYANAGHPPPIILRGEEIFYLAEGGMILGIDSGSVYSEKIFPLKSGDIILLYSDGIVETRNPRGEEFGEKRFLDLCRNNINTPELELRSIIIDTLDKFSRSSIDDDLTLIIINVE